MKKTILSWLLIGSSCAVFAQTGTDTTNRNNTGTMNTTNTGTMGDSSRQNSGNWNNSTNMGTQQNNMGTQNNATMNNGSMSTNTNYNAYGMTPVTVPTNVQLYFQRDYPAAAGSNVTWVQNGDWYHGIYNTNGRYNHVYYNMGGSTYTVSLPVTQTWVPDDIITRASTMFGPMIYDVTTMKGNNDQAVYHVRVIENGQLRSQYITDDGSTVMSPFRVDTSTQVSTGNYAGMDGTSTTTDSSGTGVNNANNMNATTTEGTTTTDANTTTSGTSGNSSEVIEMKVKNKDNKTKIKTKTADGKEQKTKIKDGEVIRKED